MREVRRRVVRKVVVVTQKLSAPLRSQKCGVVDLCWCRFGGGKGLCGRACLCTALVLLCMCFCAGEEWLLLLEGYLVIPAAHPRRWVGHHCDDGIALQGYSQKGSLYIARDRHLSLLHQSEKRAAFLI